MPSVIKLRRVLLEFYEYGRELCKTTPTVPKRSGPLVSFIGNSISKPSLVPSSLFGFLPARGKKKEPGIH